MITEGGGGCFSFVRWFFLLPRHVVDRRKRPTELVVNGPLVVPVVVLLWHPIPQQAETDFERRTSTYRELRFHKTVTSTHQSQRLSAARPPEAELVSVILQTAGTKTRKKLTIGATITAQSTRLVGAAVVGATVVVVALVDMPAHSLLQFVYQCLAFFDSGSSAEGGGGGGGGGGREAGGGGGGREEGGGGGGGGRGAAAVESGGGGGGGGRTAAGESSAAAAWPGMLSGGGRKLGGRLLTHS